MAMVVVMVVDITLYLTCYYLQCAVNWQICFYSTWFFDKYTFCV